MPSARAPTSVNRRIGPHGRPWLTLIVVIGLRAPPLPPAFAAPGRVLLAPVGLAPAAFAPAVFAPATFAPLAFAPATFAPLAFAPAALSAAPSAASVPDLSA